MILFWKAIGTLQIKNYFSSSDNWSSCLLFEIFLIAWTAKWWKANMFCPVCLQLKESDRPPSRREEHYFFVLHPILPGSKWVRFSQKPNSLHFGCQKTLSQWLWEQCGFPWVQRTIISFVCVCVLGSPLASFTFGFKFHFPSEYLSLRWLHLSMYLSCENKQVPVF